MRNLIMRMSMIANLMGALVFAAQAGPAQLQEPGLSAGAVQLVGHKPKHKINPGHPKHDPAYRSVQRHEARGYAYRGEVKHEGRRSEARRDWSEWDDYCASRYRTYDPDTGLIRNYRGEWIPCF